MHYKTIHTVYCTHICTYIHTYGKIIYFECGAIVPFIGDTVNLALGVSERQLLSLNLN